MCGELFLFPVVVYLYESGAIFRCCPVIAKKVTKTVSKVMRNGAMRWAVREFRMVEGW